MDIKTKVYGLPISYAIAFVLYLAGFSKDRASEISTCAIFVRTEFGKHVAWTWLGGLK